jgi:hypothetical protein
VSAFWSAGLALALCLGLVLGLVLAVLVLPLRLHVKGRAGVGGGHLLVRVRLMGRLCPWIVLYDSAHRAAQDRATSHPEGRTARPRLRGERLRRVLAALPRLLAEGVERLTLEALTLDLRFGLADPAETGALYGALAPVIYGAGGAFGMPLRVVPEFSGPTLDGAGDGVLRLRPIRFAGPLLRLAWVAFGPRARPGQAQGQPV